MPWSEVCSLAQACPPEQPGLYKLFLGPGGSFARTPLRAVAEGALLYVGKAQEGLRKRHEEQHLTEESGWSTLRRSLGAVLREELGFVAAPRRPKCHRSNYSFRPQDEDRLTDWMLRNLTVSWTMSVPEAGLEWEERCLIRVLRPVLNTTHNSSGTYVPELKSLRAKCRDEMRRSCRTPSE